MTVQQKNSLIDRLLDFALQMYGTYPTQGQVAYKRKLHLLVDRFRQQHLELITLVPAAVVSRIERREKEGQALVPGDIVLLRWRYHHVRKHILGKVIQSLGKYMVKVRMEDGTEQVIPRFCLGLVRLTGKPERHGGFTYIGLQYIKQGNISGGLFVFEEIFVPNMKKFSMLRIYLPHWIEAFQSIVKKNRVHALKPKALNHILMYGTIDNAVAIVTCIQHLPFSEKTSLYALIASSSRYADPRVRKCCIPIERELDQIRDLVANPRV